MRLDRIYKSISPHWPTPKALYAELDAEFRFTLDPCPLNSQANGLARSWSGERVYCNPPYDSRTIERFILKSTESDLTVFLLPAKTDAGWFHRMVLPFASEIRFVRGRLKYGDKKGNAPFASMIVVFRYKSLDV